ncbi:hypothetical protein GPECTOR_268g693 [Gonium pectorale]|uniref:Roc domain-containing protein n=1 Tax=Gonium pectorale TaxID=33097 RepID=A0A150FW38_GONPE|nr:hypothetical protein GPECTOR_268g693 [Gonium pectorale]|eukprot:KXZ41833.1 hypothetical protein GPECTOR_268g693 [Gonium pectorale]
MATAVTVAPRSKVVLVGPGSAGKTTLAHRLVSNEYKPDDMATDNMQVHEWKLEWDDKQPKPLLSIWDLGGQDGFESTHAVFMSPEAVYITVYNSRDPGQAASVDAYLQRVQTLAPGARNMVVGAWADKDDDGRSYDYLQPIALRDYKNPELKQAILELTGLKQTENGIPELKQAIVKQLNVIRLPEMYVRLRDKVRSLRESMKEEKKPRLVSLEDIIRSMEADAPKEDELHSFLSKLADFGELLQFQHVSGLKDKVVIDMEWLADVLKKIVTRDKDKWQKLQLPEGHSSVLEGHVSMPEVKKRNRAGVVKVVACGPEPELLGLLVSSQLALLQEQFPGVKCNECGKHWDMSIHKLDEQAVDWFEVVLAGRESEGTIKLGRILGAMEVVVELVVKRIRGIPSSSALAVELHKNLVRRAVALHKLVRPSQGEHLPLAVLLPESNGADKHNFPAPDEGTSNHRMELASDSTTSRLLRGSVRLHALCEYPGGLHLTDHPGYEVKEARAWLQKHGRGLVPLLHALQLVGVSGPSGNLGTGSPEEEAMNGQDMQRPRCSGGHEVPGVGKVGPNEQLASMLTGLKELLQQQGAQHCTAVATTAAEDNKGKPVRPSDLYSACQEACSSVADIVQQGNMAAGGTPYLQLVATRTAGPMWLCACHAEELGRTPRRSL